MICCNIWWISKQRSLCIPVIWFFFWKISSRLVPTGLQIWMLWVNIINYVHVVSDKPEGPHNSKGYIFNWFQRVMQGGFFLLLRFFLRVDGVLVRINDTRIYHKVTKFNCIPKITVKTPQAFLSRVDYWFHYCKFDLILSFNIPFLNWIFTARRPKVWPPLINSHSFLQPPSNQNPRTGSSWLLIGWWLHERMWIN